MRRSVTLIFAALLAITAGGSSSCLWGDPEPSQNLAPVINGFSIDGEMAERVSIRVSSQPTITLVAWDPNGDALLEENITWQVTDGELIGGGPSVRFKAPPIIWETPPQTVSATVTATVDDGSGNSISRDLVIDLQPGCTSDNQEPEIVGVFAELQEIDLGDRVVVWVEATDADGDNLTYEWIAPFGYIEGSGSTVEWVSTDVCCTADYAVQVIVSDGCGAVFDYVLVWVWV